MSNLNDMINRKWKIFLDDEEKERLFGGNLLVERETTPAEAGIEADDGAEEALTIKLPKFRVSDEWGKPTGKSEDRDQIRVFFRNMPAGDIRTKIGFVQRFLENCEKEICGSQRSISSILANLIFLETLASVIYDFNAKTGGYLFESFLAALLGGKARAVPATDKEGIQDIYTQTGKPISLKLYQQKPDAQSAPAGGSLVDLRSSVADGTAMPYVMAVKEMSGEGDGGVSKITFYEYYVGSNGKTIQYYRMKGKKGEKKEAWYRFTPTQKSQDIKGLLYAEDYIAPYKNVEKSTPKTVTMGVPGTPRFSIPSADAKAAAEAAGNVYSLNFGTREELKQVADKYAKQLGSDVTKIYNTLDAFSNNINKYLAGGEKAAGPLALEDAIQLRDATSKVTDT
tara:strand:+ start:1362 stop:2552 length:1191 start_codon:yes stop_codon:yes gene_type:complete